MESEQKREELQPVVPSGEESLENKKQTEDLEGKLSLSRIFLGDFLLNDFLRRQALLLVLIVVYTVFYISNRYSCQQEMLEIDRLRGQLTDIKYDALTRSSELAERTRRSRIEEYVLGSGSELQISTDPPFVIEK